MVVLKELISNSFNCGRVSWFWRNSFLTISTFGGYGGLERTEIFNSFNIGAKVWWSWKNWFLTVINCERVWWVLKELIFNSSYFKRMWWSWKSSFLIVPTLRGWWLSWNNWCLTVSTVGRYGGPERTEIFNSFNCGRVWWSWKNWFLTVINCCRACGGLERTDF